MKKLLLILLTWPCTVALINGQLNDWENPEIFAINKQAPRSTSMVYPSEELALKDIYEESPYYIPLSGKWKFCQLAIDCTLSEF